MCPELGKWGKIAVILNSSKGEGDVDRDRDACKYKWTTLLSDFKKIWDFHRRTGMNSEAYFTDTSAEEKKQHKLPKSFYAAAYRNMAEWLRNKATINPPHARDTSDPLDANYGAPVPGESTEVMDELDMMREDAWRQVPLNAASHIDLTAGESPSVSSAHGQPGVGGSSGVGQDPTVPTHTASAAEIGRRRPDFVPPRRVGDEINLNAPPAHGGTSQRTGPNHPAPSANVRGSPSVGYSAPAGSVLQVSRQGRPPNEVHVLSSSATSAAVELRKTFGSTGHRKKRSADTTAIAEGVSQSAEKMAKILSDINDTQKTTEREKLEVQTRHFREALDYKIERDRMALENVRIAQEHTRLGLMNQQMVVQAIANLASAISRTPPPNVTPHAAQDANPNLPPEVLPCLVKDRD